MPTQRAVLIDGPGEAAEVLRLAEVPRPVPGPGQVLVRLKRRPINPADLLFIAGRYGGKPTYPATPGGEGMGEIAALGEGVTTPAVGTRVVPLDARATWQDYIVHDARAVLPVRDGIDDASAAQLVANPLAAWVMLTEELRLRPGDWLAQSAASSALGRLVIQLAKARGIRTVNLVRRREQLDRVRAWGGDEAICTADDDAVERIRAITGGVGVAAALDAVGGPTGSVLVKSLGRGGIMLVHGVLDGRSIAVHPGWLLAKGASVRGFWLRHWFAANPVERWREIAGDLLARLEDLTITLPVEATYPLEDVRAAVAHAEGSGRHGKVLLGD
jgi:NADPH:quinone reductase-like Zn-dependent oxidoreductase